jgi:regulator of sirC expression with transglutaminase-like and TPR domain
LYTRFGVALSAEKKKNRLAHVGTDLSGRAAQLVTRTLGQHIDISGLNQRISTLLNFKLGFTDREDEFDDVVKKWMNYLAGFGLSKETARAIVRNAAFSGADVEPRNPLDVFTGKVLETRNGYDLVCAALKHARNQPTHVREKIQTVGLSLLLPTTKKAFGGS